MPKSKLHKFVFSPPARLAWLAAKIYQVPREIAKHFHAHFNLEPDKNDHWYPSDPTERAKVDEWLAFSDKNHMTLCMPGLMTAVNTFGMPWRKTYGVFIARMSAQKK